MLLLPICFLLCTLHLSNSNFHLCFPSTILLYNRLSRMLNLFHRKMAQQITTWYLPVLVIKERNNTITGHNGFNHYTVVTDATFFFCIKDEDTKEGS